MCFVCLREGSVRVNEDFGGVNESFVGVNSVLVGVNESSVGVNGVLVGVNESSGEHPEDTVGHKKKSDRIISVNVKCILPKKVIFFGK